MTAPGIAPRVLARGLVLIVTLGLIGWAMERFGFGHLLDTGWVEGEVKGHGLAGLAIFLAVGSLAIAVGAPRQAVSFLGGYAAGLIAGTIIALAATVIGSALDFVYARLIGRETVRRWLGGRAQKVDDFIGRNTFATTVMIRFLPVGNNLLTNLVAGVSAVPFAPFMLGSAVGFLPQTIVFALLGSGIRVDPELRIGLAVALFLVSALLGVVLYRRRKNSAET